MHTPVPHICHSQEKELAYISYIWSTKFMFFTWLFWKKCVVLKTQGEKDNLKNLDQIEGILLQQWKPEHGAPDLRDQESVEELVE